MTIQEIDAGACFAVAGRRLAAWREDAGLTVRAAAKRAGVALANWSCWERGLKRPSLEHALELELLTSGAVPFEAWGYDSALAAVLAVAARRRAKAAA